MVLGAAGLSSLLAGIDRLEVGWRIIIVTIVVAAAAATWLPQHRPRPETAEVAH